jgi:crotonobetaine/carnitine-CoA ligase
MNEAPTPRQVCEHVNAREIHGLTCHYLDQVDHLDPFRRRGENVSAYEFELAINDLPGVHESAALGVPSKIGKEGFLAVIQGEPGVAPDPAATGRYCDEHLPHVAVPRYLRCIDDLPRTLTNRVEKYKLGRLDGSTVDRTRAN